MSTTYAGRYGAAPLHLPSGAAAVGQLVEVRTVPGGALATLWANKDRSTSQANPVISDSLGNLNFFADPAEYDLVANSGAPVRVIVENHPSEPASPSNLHLLAYDTAGNHPDGSMPALADSGHAWAQTGAQGMTIAGGRLTTPGGAGVVANGYAYITPTAGSAVLVAAGYFGFGSTGSTTDSAVCMAAVDSGWPNLAVANALFHISVSTVGIQVSTFTGGPVFTYLNPRGYSYANGFLPFAAPLKCDGATTYLLMAAVDRVASVLYVWSPGGRVLRYDSPVFGTLTAPTVFWQARTPVATGYLPGWTQVWSDTTLPVPQYGVPTILETAKAATAAKAVSAGMSGQRPPSAISGGGVWIDLDAAAAGVRLEYSDGSFWRRVSDDVIVGNRYTAMISDATDTSLFPAPSGATCTRARSILHPPPGRSSHYRAVTTGSGVWAMYPNTTAELPAVVAGSTYTGFVLGASGDGTSRQAKVTLAYYNASTVSVGSFSGTLTTLPADGTYAPLLVSGAAPAGAVKCLVQITGTAAGVGEVYDAGQYGVALGTLTAPVET